MWPWLLLKKRFGSQIDIISITRGQHFQNIQMLKPRAVLKAKAVHSTLYKWTRAFKLMDIAESEESEHIRPLADLYEFLFIYINSCCTYCWKEHTRSNRILVLLFNARFIPYRAFFDAFRYHDIDCIVHERGHVKSSYILQQNIAVDDVYTAIRSILKSSTWNSKITDIERNDLVAYVNSRLRGQSLGGPQFSPAISQSRLQYEDLPILAIYTGSLDEKLPVIGRQFENFYHSLFSNLKNSCEGRFRVHIRHHPNLASGIASRRSAKEQVEYINKLAVKFFREPRIHGPDSKLSTYELLLKSEINCAPFSTLSLESLLLDKKTITSEICFFKDLFFKDNLVSAGSEPYDISSSHTGSPSNIHVSFAYRYFIGSSIVIKSLEQKGLYNINVELLRAVLEGKYAGDHFRYQQILNDVCRHTGQKRVLMI
jgi:hypothetical protein